MAVLRRPVPRTLVVDATVAVCAFAMGVAYLGIIREQVRPDFTFEYWPAFGVVALVTLPLAIRRWKPLLVLAIATVATCLAVVHFPLDGLVVPIAYFVALYSAGAYATGPRRNWVRGISVLAAAVSTVIATYTTEFETDNRVSTSVLRWFFWAVEVFYLGTAWVVGNATRTRLRHERELAERADELAAAHATIAAQAVHEERVRVARELHDVLAHHVSVMGVQAGAARRVLDRSPEQAAEAMRSIEDASRTAVAELHRLLGFLHREGDVDQGTAPQPSLRRVGDLITQMRAAGLDVTLHVAALPPTLPAVVDLSAYRVVQEALTNTLKHAGPGTSATVTLAYEDDELRVEVVDDGHGGKPSTLGAVVAGAGRGLVGMRERVGLTGGALTVGRRFDGGFGVAATFPLASG